jgi:hypothetical protein
VFFVFVGGRRVRVEKTGAGRFWCLYCETECDYERRAWALKRSAYFIPVAVRYGEFVLCRSCEAAFDPECLDESSTASCEELLLIDVPQAAITTRLRPQPDRVPLTGHLPRRDVSLSEYLDGEE